MFTFLHAADIHLDSPLRGLERYPGVQVDTVRGATRRALENLVQLALEREVHFVVIAGDLYDGDWRDHHTGMFFVAQMNRLRSADIPVILIAGNHDAANKMTRSLPLPSNVQMLASGHAETASHPKLEELGVAIHGQSFAHAAETNNFAREYPSPRKGMFNIGILHTALDGRDGHDRYAPCSLVDLQQKEYDYWALGHVHARQVVSAAPYIVFSGNTQGRHIRETGAKGCYLVNVDHSGSVDLQFEPLDVMRWEVCNLDASSCTSPDELLGQFQEFLGKASVDQPEMPLSVRVVISGNSPCHQLLLDDANHWIHQFRAIAIQASVEAWVEKVKIATLPLDQWNTESVGEGPIGELLRCYHQLRSDREQLSELKGEFQELLKKLPDDVLYGPDGLMQGGSEQFGLWLDEALTMVIGRLGVGRLS
jgi:exonuclease SbcD